MKGTVKFFNQSKNFGFIEPEDKSKDLFVHKNDIVSGVLNEGDQVEFDAEEGDKGKKAVNVKKID
ncbi:cold-shock protein [Elusimicrobiota bacterium]